MIRTLTKTALAAATSTSLFVMPASAEKERTYFDVEITVDHATDAASAERVLQSLERQARNACRRTQPGTLLKTTDWNCARDVVEKAIAKSNNLSMAAAYADRMQTADTDVTATAKLP